ncbi:MAG TPA: LysR substrate-binding domain-containing protein [Rhodanobacteraceae bacterium]
MISISPRQLEVFVAIATTGSVRVAAEQLHLTQPAASMALAELERHLEAPLFVRARGRLHLSEHGREMLPRAREVLDRLEDVQRRAAGRPRELIGELRIGASNTVGNYLVGDLLGDFVRAQARVNVRLRVDNTRAIIAAVCGHELDIGCVEGPVAQADLEVLPWRSDALVVCASTDHPLAHRRRLRVADFAAARWILREQGSATRAQSERVLATLPPGETVLEMGQVEAIKQAVIAGLGMACLPEVAVGDAVAAGRLAVLKTPFLDLERRLSLILIRGSYRGALVEAFLATVR